MAVGRESINKVRHDVVLDSIQRIILEVGLKKKLFSYESLCLMFDPYLPSCHEIMGDAVVGRITVEQAKNN